MKYFMFTVFCVLIVFATVQPAYLPSSDSHLVKVVISPPESTDHSKFYLPSFSLPSFGFNSFAPQDGHQEVSTDSPKKTSFKLPFSLPSFLNFNGEPEPTNVENDPTTNDTVVVELENQPNASDSACPSCGNSITSFLSSKLPFSLPSFGYNVVQSNDPISDNHPTNNAKVLIVQNGNQEVAPLPTQTDSSSGTFIKSIKLPLTSSGPCCTDTSEAALNRPVGSKLVISSLPSFKLNVGSTGSEVAQSPQNPSKYVILSPNYDSTPSISLSPFYKFVGYPSFKPSGFKIIGYPQSQPSPRINVVTFAVPSGTNEVPMAPQEAPQEAPSSNTNDEAPPSSSSFYFSPNIEMEVEPLQNNQQTTASEAMNTSKKAEDSKSKPSISSNLETEAPEATAPGTKS